MGDRICAPLEYDQHHKGYRYSDESFTLPSFHVSQEEMVSILLAKNLLSHSAGGLISQAIQSFGRKLFVTMGQIGFSPDKLRDAFSAVWNGYSPSQASTFRIVLNALLQNRLIKCGYSSPASRERTDRTIAPVTAGQKWTHPPTGNGPISPLLCIVAKMVGGPTSAGAFSLPQKRSLTG